MREYRKHYLQAGLQRKCFLYSHTALAASEKKRSGFELVRAESYSESPVCEAG